MDFDFKRNEKYYTTSNTMLLVGIALTLIGLVIWYMFRWWYIIGNVLVVIPLVGIILIFMWLGKRSNDADIDSQASAATEDLQKYAVEKLNLFKTVNNALPPSTLAGYDFEDLEARKIVIGRDGRARTDRYGAFAFIFTPDKLHVYTRQFSLLEGGIKENSLAIPFLEIAKMEILEEDFVHHYGKENKKEANVKNTVFAITKENGEVIRYYFHKSVDADNIIENVERYKKQNRAAQN